MRAKTSSKDVHELSEILVDRTVEVEEKAFSLIAKYQPVASDLRIINSYMKVAYDFERYGRYAWDISFISTRFNGKTATVTNGYLSTSRKWLKKFFKWFE